MREFWSMEETGLHSLNYPTRVYLETTTKCNLSCDMCVKQSGSGGIIEGDFDPRMISAVEPVLPHVKSLILNGIGEPALYPDLERIISRAAQMMSNDSYIGFQTNGMLVGRDRARSLVGSGLNLVCVSIDASVSETFSRMRNGGELSDAENAIRHFTEAGNDLNRRVKVGIEFVMTRDNIHQLVPVIEIAHRHGAEFAIVTHLIAYDEKNTIRAAFENNTDDAIELYENILRKSAEEGVDIKRYFDIRWKFNHTEEEKRIIEAVEDMTAHAGKDGIYINLKNIMNRDVNIRREVEQVFSEAEKLASELGLELRLPAVIPEAEKRCDFIESGSVFISWNGDVHPCYFLWHKYQCYVSGWKKYVEPLVFGNLHGKNLIDIWNAPEYISFRQTVSRYDYPLCSNCSLAPCDYIYSEKFEQDCYTNIIPCCDCQWCVGVFHCLR